MGMSAGGGVKIFLRDPRSLLTPVLDSNMRLYDPNTPGHLMRN